MAPGFLSKLVKAAGTSTASTNDTDPTGKKKPPAAGRQSSTSTTATTSTERSSPPPESRRSSFQVSLSGLTRGASRNRAVSSPPVSKHSSPAASTPSVHRRAIHRKAESAPHETPELPSPPSDSLGVSQPESGRRSRRNSIITSVFGGGKKDKDIVPQAQGRQAPSNGDTSGSARNHVAHSQSSTTHSTAPDYDGYDSSDDDQAIPRIVTVAPTRSRRGSRESFAQSETSTQLGVTIIPPSPLTYAPSLPGTTSTRSSVREIPAVQNVAEATSQKQESNQAGQREAQAPSVTTPTAPAFPTSSPLSSTTPSSSPPQPQTTASVLVSILSGRRRTASISSAISGIIGFGGSKPPELKETTESPVTPATEATPTPTTASTIKANYFASRQGSSEDIPPVPPLPTSVTAASSSDSKSSANNMAPARSQTTLTPAGPERPGMPRKTSSRSLTNLPPPIQVPDHSIPPVPTLHSAASAAGQAQSQHARAATTPEGHTVYADGDTNVTMTPIVESPTMLKHPEFTTSPASIGTASSQGGSSSARPPSSGGGGGGGSSWLSPKKGQDDDTASIMSTNEGGGKKRLFKRSTSRKPTGLASALAATGMAMANPSISALHAAQMSTAVNQQQQQQTSPARSQTEMVGSATSSTSPYMSKSPANSVVSNGGQRNATTMVGSPKSVKSAGRKVSSPSGSRKGKGRRPSVSAFSDGAASWTGTSLSVNGGGSEYYSGGESEGARSHISRTSRRSRAAGSGNESDTEDESSDDGTTDSSDDELLDSLSIEQDDIPVTGFAVASNKRNADFHELFPSVPEGDYLIEDYGCALQREILIQGRLYISENHICFHANIFGWITDLAIPIDEITTLEKKMTAFVIPNAIQITTRQARYTFASFLSRDTTYDVIYNIWRLHRPDDARSIRSGRGSLDAPASASALALEGATSGGVGGLKVGVAKKIARRATQCDCGRDGKHFTQTAMEATFPGSPEMIHNLMFASGFIKDFLSIEQKLIDIQTSDWMPISPGSVLLQRNMSYIKPLNAPMGPKQTKCEIQDVMEHQDFDKYISTLTTTRTPDVPSGGVFSVKTRTCIMWAGPASSKVLVSSQVEWTGRSFIRGIIERSAIDGQKVYHGELERAMRAYIQEHHSEFVPEGALEAAAEEEAEADPEDQARELTPGGEASGAAGAEKSKEQLSKEEREKQREKERNQRVWQWAWDTCEGAFGVAKSSTSTIVDLIGDAWDQSSSTTILYFVIVILVLSNFYTLIRMGKKEEVGRRKEMMKAEEREKWVQSVVVTLWDELAAGRMEPGEVREKFLEQTGRGKGPSSEGVLSLPPSVIKSLWPSSISTDAVPVPTEAVTPSAVKEVPVKDGGETEERLKVLEASLKATDDRLKVVDETLQKTQESLENINRVLASFMKHHLIDKLD